MSYQVKPIRRGRKSKSSIEYARAAYWAYSLLIQSGKSFSEIERIVKSKTISKKDGGGFNQPNSYHKYAAGENVPEFGTSTSTLELTEIHFPNSSNVFHSFTWDILNVRTEVQISAESIYERLDSRIFKYLNKNCFIAPNSPILNEHGKNTAEKVNHIDVLGLYLVSLRYTPKPTLSDIQHLQNWLIYNSDLPPISLCKKTILPVFEEFVPEFGPIVRPYGIISNPHTRNFSTLLAGIYSGILFNS